MYTYIYIYIYMTYYDTIGYKTIYHGKYLSYECEHIVQSYSVDRIGKQNVIYIAYVQNHS